MWPVPLICVLAFAPESPWWFVRKGRYEEAQKVITRLESARSGRNPVEIVAMMQRTIEIEDKKTEGASYSAIFKGIDAKRTLSVDVVLLFVAFRWESIFTDLTSAPPVSSSLLKRGLVFCSATQLLSFF